MTFLTRHFSVLVAIIVASPVAKGFVTGERFDTPIPITDGMPIDLDGDGTIEVTLTKQVSLNPTWLITSYDMNGVLLGPDTETWAPTHTTVPYIDNSNEPRPRLALPGDTIGGANNWFQFSDSYRTETVPALPDKALMFSSILVFNDETTVRARAIDQVFIALRWERDGDTTYGWIELSADEVELGNDQYEHPYYYHGYAYETVHGAALTAGAIPEPTTLSIFSIFGALLLKRH